MNPTFQKCLRRSLFCLVVVPVVIPMIALACMSSKTAKTFSRKNIPASFKKTQRQPSSQFAPFAAGHPSPSWEARLGNLLLDLSSKNGEVTLSLPVQIQRSGYHPFGDGQSNAKLSLGGDWKQTEFPVVGTQVKGADGKFKREYRFHPSLKIKNFKEELVAGELYRVRPEGWKDAFYFSFKTGVLKIDDFLSGIPDDLRTFKGGRVAPNPAKVPVVSGVDRFTKKALGEGYNKDAWFNDNVHGLFPNSSGEKTAVGGVLTWGITEGAFGPFKQLYTCFEARNAGLEKTHGVPSGAGFHHIGDAAETILNNLETESLPVALGVTHGQSDAAYGLNESISATWMPTQSAMVTVKNEFHWYLNPIEASVCTEIWVHNCVPTLENNWGFRCQ